MVEELNIDLNNFFVEVEGKNVKLNILAVLGVGKDLALVITDFPPMGVSNGHYDIVLFDKETDSISGIENEELYESLHKIWEEKLKEVKDEANRRG